MDRRPVVAILFLMSGSLLGCDDASTIAPTQRFFQVTDSLFTVSASDTLWVESFAGNVDIVPGQASELRVMATRRANRVVDLSGIGLEMMGVPGGVRVVTSNPSRLQNVSVDLAITAPPDTRPSISNGAGTTNYQGPAEGLSRFNTGAGTIRLRLPSDVNVTVQLGVGAGTIHLGFPVNGQVGAQSVSGTIGTGADGEIIAQVGSGDIYLTPQ
jgi:hypothetical protein